MAGETPDLVDEAAQSTTALGPLMGLAREASKAEAFLQIVT